MSFGINRFWFHINSRRHFQIKTTANNSNRGGAIVVETFNREAKGHQDRVRKILTQTSYANDAVLPFPLRQSLDRVDAELDLLIYEAFPLPKAG
jgi:hypothetical protein